MPNNLHIKRDPGLVNVASLSEPCEAHPLVIKELNSVTPSTAPRATRHWLTRLFTSPDKPALVEKIALAEVLAQSENQCPGQQTQETSSTRGWALAGAALTFFSVAGTLAWGLARRSGEESAEHNAVSNITDPGALLPAEQPFPQALALALAGYPAPGLSHARQAETLRQWTFTNLTNTLREDLLTRIPGILEAPVEQLLITPLLEMLVASAVGHRINRAELAEQLTRLVNVTLATLNIQENLQLYRRDRTEQDSIPFIERFVADNGRGYVPFSGQTYPLEIGPNGVPFIIDREGRCHFIRYHQQAARWEYIDEADNYGWSPEARELSTRFRVRLLKLPQQLTMDYYPQYDYAGINSTGWIHTRGLFIGGNFLPVWSPNNVPGETFTNIEIGTEVPRRLLRKGDYGWEFERPSVRMDAYLKALLETSPQGISNDYQKVIGSISHKDGLCVDMDGKSWLKKDHQYFRAERSESASPEQQQIILPDYANAQVEYNNGVMLLKQADDIPFALNTTTIRNSLIAGGPFMIETTAVDYLQKNALTTAARPVNDLYYYHSGLAEDKDYATMLVINDKKYAVRDYSKKFIRLINRHTPTLKQKDIFLWAAGNTLLRVRNGQSAIQYVPLDPHGTIDTSRGAPPVVVEAELHQLLRHFIDAGRDISLSADEKAALKMYNYLLFWASAPGDKGYFLYQGCYFPAMLIEPNNQDNPLGHPRIDIFASKDFYSTQELIASLVAEVKTDRLEIKTAASFLAERLGVSKNIAALYAEDKP